MELLKRHKIAFFLILLIGDKVLIVDYKKIQENYLKYAKIKKTYAVLKANAYGFGLEKIYKTLKEVGCNDFAVISKNEAIYLRKLDKKINILLLSNFNIYDIEELLSKKIIVTVSKIEHYNCLKEYNKKCFIQLKIDTGMKRFGLSKENFDLIVNDIKKRKNNKIIITGIYTHMACSYTSYFYSKQFNLFKEIVKDHKIGDIHVASTNGYLYDDFTNAIRIGLGLYENAVTLKGRIKKIVKLEPLEAIGYDLKYTSNFKKSIAICDVGYADGLLRNNSERLVYYRNKKTRIVGNICMNHSFVLVDENALENEEIEFLGKNISLTYVSKYLKTTPHEVLLSINQTKSW